MKKLKYVALGLGIILVLAALGLYVLYLSMPPAARIPEDAYRALTLSNASTLYSLEPNTVGEFHNYSVLGKIQLNEAGTRKAAREFENVVPTRHSGVRKFCFDPRHALRVVHDNHAYDFLLCYECDSLVIYKDATAIGRLPAYGSPSVLNGMLDAAGLPISKSGR